MFESRVVSFKDQPIWNQIKREPEKFEIFFKVPNEHGNLF